MSAATTVVTVSMVDKGGYKCRLQFFLPATVIDPEDAKIKVLVGWLNYLLCPAVLSVELSQGIGFTGTSSLNNDYATVRDKVVLRGIGAAGSFMKRPGRWQIPGPNAGAILQNANTKKVDTAKGAYTNFATIVAANVVNRAGQAYGGLNGGYRFTMRRRTRR